MTGTIATPRPPEPDFATITTTELHAYREAENRFRASDAAWTLLGAPDPGAAIGWQKIARNGRDLPVRVYRPAAAEDVTARSKLPLVIHVHGGGFVGTAVQCDWTNSHLAARLPALVVSVEHRLLAAGSPMSNAADDGWDVLEHVLHNAEHWGIDPARTAVFGESCGALITALTAIRAGAAGRALKAQVLVNPVVDVTETMLDYPSISKYGYSPTRALPQLRLIQRLAVPPGASGKTVSPLYANDAGRLAPALVLVPTHDALADHGRRYAERLRDGGTAVQLTEYPGARHAFLTLPGVEAQAESARAEIFAFLRDALTP